MSAFSILTRDHVAHTIVASGKLDAVHKFCCGSPYHETDVIMVRKADQSHSNHQAKDL